jgi:hypothetical protein
MAVDSNPVFSLLRRIEEKHFGSDLECLDIGDDVPDSDLLNGFMEGFNETDSESEFEFNQNSKTYNFVMFSTILFVLVIAMILYRQIY